MIGGSGNDKMFGMADNDKMSGGDGDDQMWGNSGDDVMDGGAGNDYISGGQGNDIISDGDGDDIVLGNSGDDIFIAGLGDDSYDGGSGFDTIDFSNASNKMFVDLNNHIATGMGNDTIKGVEAVIGSRFDDTLIGDKNANVFYGGDGNDSFRGRGGADTFTSGAGRDVYNWAIKDVDAVDHITDFSKEDQLNLRDLLKGQQFASSVKEKSLKLRKLRKLSADGFTIHTPILQHTYLWWRLGPPPSVKTTRRQTAFRFRCAQSVVHVTAKDPS